MMGSLPLGVTEDGPGSAIRFLGRGGMAAWLQERAGRHHVVLDGQKTHAPMARANSLREARVIDPFLDRV